MFDDLILPFFKSKWPHRLSWVALVLSSLLLIGELIKTPITWYHDYQLASKRDYTSEIPMLAMQSLELIKQIPDWHLFGEVNKPIQSNYLPITSLQLKLVGIVQAIPTHRSSVIISEAGQPGKVYLVGDVLPVGVKIGAITEDGVILENAGRMEKLPLQRQPLFFQGLPKKLLRED